MSTKEETKKIIDDLGEWLCDDILSTATKEVRKDDKRPYAKNFISTKYMEQAGLARYVADRIKFYRDNILEY